LHIPLLSLNPLQDYRNNSLLKYFINFFCFLSRSFKKSKE
jgi:hypothetical protein